MALLVGSHPANAFALPILSYPTTRSLPLTLYATKQHQHHEWPSIVNVHRVLGDERFCRRDFTNIIVSEKLDGANLGIEMDGKDGNLVALHGRNSVLWYDHYKGVTDPFQLTYGSVKGRFESLREVVEPLKLTVQGLQANDDFATEEATSFVFYGEWCNPTTSTVKQQHQEPSWHPFGVAVIRNDGSKSIYAMTTALHAILTSNGLHPPRILAQTKDIPRAIEVVFHRMLNPPEMERFEGVVLTVESNQRGGNKNPRAQLFGLGCKWKTAAFEEQPQFLLDNVSFIQDLAPTVDLLKQVYEQRQERQNGKRKRKKTLTKEQMEQESELTRQVLLAFHSVMSKSALSAEDVRNMQDRDARTVELQRINHQVVLDLEDQYKQVGVMELPEEVRKAAGTLVSKYIMKPPTA
ncbi:expressed unknown protein [Seminavis robusta]|uniref:RNA ligase domain-containing protein n=1 Tax=Seminavis robusta TaxID=568900 RepID=A0A9N8EHN9_9STRA|nr:expressed unknown protein [Seminavis robusta]|eukprot:Sro1149_g246600.1 n/a (408) ;mRNA; f:30048-31271